MNKIIKIIRPIFGLIILAGEGTLIGVQLKHELSKKDREAKFEVIGRAFAREEQKIVQESLKECSNMLKQQES